MTSLYECSVHVDSDQLFHPDALRIINDCDTYIAKMKKYIEGLKHCTHEPAGFDCISDNSTSSRYHQYAADQRVWAESEPAKVGIYRAFTRSHTKDRREQKKHNGPVTGPQTSHSTSSIPLWASLCAFSRSQYIHLSIRCC